MSKVDHDFLFPALPSALDNVIGEMILWLKGEAHTDAPRFSYHSFYDDHLFTSSDGLTLTEERCMCLGGFIVWYAGKVLPSFHTALLAGENLGLTADEMEYMYARCLNGNNTESIINSLEEYRKTGKLKWEKESQGIGHPYRQYLTILKGPKPETIRGENPSYVLCDFSGIEERIIHHQIDWGLIPVRRTRGLVSDCVV